MSPRNIELPEVESTDPLEPEDVAEIAPRDSEIDFDDEREDDQRPLDVVEAIEVGALLDDPDELAEEEDEADE